MTEETREKKIQDRLGYVADLKEQLNKLIRFNDKRKNEFNSQSLESLILGNKALKGLTKVSCKSHLGHLTVQLQCKDFKDFQNVPVLLNDFAIIFKAGPDNSYITENRKESVVIGMVTYHRDLEIEITSYSRDDIVQLDSDLDSTDLILVPFPFDPMLRKMDGCLDALCDIIRDGDHRLNPLSSRIIDRDFDDLVPEENFIIDLDGSLKSAQIEAIKGALFSKFAYLIHGPPGTGKSRVLFEIMKIFVKKMKKKVLFCSSTHVKAFEPK